APWGHSDRACAVVRVRKLRRADRTGRGQLKSPLVERVVGVGGGRRPVLEVAWEVELELELLPVLRPDTVDLRVAGVLHEGVGLRGVEGVRVELGLVAGVHRVRNETVGDAGNVFR